MMNELTTATTQLPETIDDLTQFVLVGKAKLQAYMLKLQTVNKLSVAQEIRDQTLQEAQEISNALIAAEQRIGELLLAIPKQAGASNFSRDEEKLKTKGETIKEMGYGKNEASDYQQMAKHPEVVKKVMEDALANGEVVTKASVMREIKFYKNRIADLEKKKNPEPEVREVEVEVVPDDYEDLKNRNASFTKENKMLLDGKRKQDAEIKQLRERLADLETRQGVTELQKKLEEEAGHFAIRTYDYIQKNGGYVWVTERMKDLQGDSRKQFINAVYAIDAFAKQMIENIGGYGIE